MDRASKASFSKVTKRGSVYSDDDDDDDDDGAVGGDADVMLVSMMVMVLLVVMIMRVGMMSCLQWFELILPLSCQLYWGCTKW